MKKQTGNPILWGVAEELEEPKPQVRKAVQKVLATEGFYIATDTDHPEAETMLVSMSGKIYSMSPDNELAPGRFLNTVKFHGPFRAPRPTPRRR